MSNINFKNSTPATSGVTSSTVLVGALDGAADEEPELIDIDAVVDYIAEQILAPLSVARGGTGAITAPLARGTLAATPIAVTSVSDPNRTGVQGQAIPTMQSDWYTANNAIWMQSPDSSIYPAQIQVTGTWAGGDVARVRFNTNSVNYDFSYTVQGGDTNAVIAAGLRTAILANSTFLALPVYVQAVTVSAARFDICFEYAAHPITVSNNASTTALGTFTFTQAENLLDGPVGFHIQRSLLLARTPVANDNIGGVFFWGPLDAGQNGVTYGRIDVFIDDPVTASLQGRMQFATADSSTTDAMGRMFLRKGLLLTTATGASPSGGTNGDMGAGTINTPDLGGYYCNGNGFLRSSGNNIQLINNTGAGILQLGANAVGVVNVSASAVYPEADATTNLGIASTREWNDVLLSQGSIISFDNGAQTITDDSGASSPGILFANSLSGLQAAISSYNSVGASAAPNLALRRARGSQGSPTAVNSGDRLGAVFFTGQDATGGGFPATNVAAILCLADENFSSTAHGNHLEIATTPIGSTTRTKRIDVGNAGLVAITGSFGLGAPVTKTGDFTLADTENHIINNRAATNTVTLPAASSWTGRMVYMKTIQAQTVVSASSNVVPSTSATAGTAILPATDGAWALLVSDGTDWIIMAANPLV